MTIGFSVASDFDPDYFIKFLKIKFVRVLAVHKVIPCANVCNFPYFIEKMQSFRFEMIWLIGDTRLSPHKRYRQKSNILFIWKNNEYDIAHASSYACFFIRKSSFKKNYSINWENVKKIPAVTFFVRLRSCTESCNTNHSIIISKSHWNKISRATQAVNQT